MVVGRLIERLKQKDERAFEEVYDMYYTIVFYVINNVVKDVEGAKDVAQDTFLTMFYKIHQYNGGNFKYWLLQIAKNKAINYLSQVIREKEKVTKKIIEIQNKGDVEFDCQEFSREVEEILDPESSKIIINKLIYDYTFKEISKEMNLNMSAVYRKYQDGILKIQKAMGIK